MDGRNVPSDEDKEIWHVDEKGEAREMIVTQVSTRKACVDTRTDSMAGH